MPIPWPKLSGLLQFLARKIGDKNEIPKKLQAEMKGKSIQVLVK